MRLARAPAFPARLARLAAATSAVARLRRADEGADLVGILLARRALDAGGDIDAGRAGDAQRLADIAGIEARPTA